MARKQIATFLAPNKGLSIAGEFAYGFAGLFGASTTEFEMFNFTTGKETIVGEFILNGSVLFTSDSHLGSNSAFKITFNGVAVSTVKIDTTGTDIGMPMTNNQAVVIPPLTRVIVSCICGEDTTTEKVSAMFVGRVYA